MPLPCECILKSAEPFTLPPDMEGPLCFVLPVLVRFVGLVSVSQECCRVGTSWLHQSVVNHWTQGLHVYISSRCRCSQMFVCENPFLVVECVEFLAFFFARFRKMSWNSYRHKGHDHVYFYFMTFIVQFSSHCFWMQSYVLLLESTAGKAFATAADPVASDVASLNSTFWWFFLQLQMRDFNWFFNNYNFWGGQVHEGLLSQVRGGHLFCTDVVSDQGWRWDDETFLRLSPASIYMYIYIYVYPYISYLSHVYFIYFPQTSMVFSWNPWGLGQRGPEEVRSEFLEGSSEGSDSGSTTRALDQLSTPMFRTSATGASEMKIKSHCFNILLIIINLL